MKKNLIYFFIAVLSILSMSGCSWLKFGGADADLSVYLTIAGVEYRCSAVIGFGAKSESITGIGCHPVDPVPEPPSTSYGNIPVQFGGMTKYCTIVQYDDTDIKGKGCSTTAP